MASYWWINRNCFVNLWLSISNLFRVAVSMALIFFVPLFDYRLSIFFSTFFISFFGQKYFRIKLHSGLYVFIIRYLRIFGFPLSLDRSRTMKVSYRWRGDTFSRAIDVMVWCSFIIISPKSCCFSDYWVPSQLSR